MKLFVAGTIGAVALRSRALCTLDHPATGKTRAGAGVRFARPNIQIHDAHVVDLVPMGLHAQLLCSGTPMISREGKLAVARR